MSYKRLTEPLSPVTRREGVHAGHQNPRAEDPPALPLLQRAEEDVGAGLVREAGLHGALLHLHREGCP